MASRSRQPKGRLGTPRESKWAPGEWWEWLAILFAVAALWPKILRWQPGVIWDIVLLVALLLMVVVAVRRTRRMRRDWDE